MSDETTTTLRRCSGSARFGIEPHEAPPEDFPRQPSQKDGLGRMCTTHWNAYTRGLAREAKARKGSAESRDKATTLVGDQDADSATEQRTAEPEPAGKRARRTSTPEADGEDAAAG